MAFFVFALVLVGQARADLPSAGPLLLVGGGKRDQAALKQFIQWSVAFSEATSSGSAEPARILVAPWASAEGTEACATVKEDLQQAVAALASGNSPAPAVTLECAPAALEPTAFAEAKKAVQRAHALFFTGGDQARLMDALDDSKLTPFIRSRHRQGLPVGGTSAGLAVLSDVILTGEGDFTTIAPDAVGTRRGLDLAQGMIFDQHFLKRQRLNRLLSALQGHEGFVGIGVDEDVAASLTPEGKLTVLTEGTVVVARPIAHDPRRFNLRLLSKGDWIKL